MNDTCLRIAATVGITALAALGARAQGDGAANPSLAAIPAAEARLRAAALEKKLPFPLEQVAVRVEKKARRMTLLSRGEALRTFRVAIGRTPEGHKQREGDGRTPEGSYYICYRNPESKYHLFLGLSYPSPRDAERALADGRIDAATAASLTSVVAPACPDWYTPLGGEVGIHGHGAGRDWTAGCVALEDADMDEVWAACATGTAVEIVP